MQLTQEKFKSSTDDERKAQESFIFSHTICKIFKSMT